VKAPRHRGARALPCGGVLWLGALATLLSAGCVQTRTARFPTASHHPEAGTPEVERRPDGVSIELESGPPAYQDRTLSEDAMGSLRAPLGLEDARRVVVAFFRAVLDENISGVSKLLRPGAMAYDTRTSGTPRTLNLLAQWRNRFSQFEYESLRSRVVFRPSDLRSYRPPHLDRLPLEVRELEPSTNDGTSERAAVVMRATLLARSVDGAQLFGPEIYFWLERDDNRYEIVQVAENVPY